MEYDLDDYQTRVLSQMYRSYEKWTKENKKYKGNSVLFSALKMTKNSRHDFLRTTAEEYIDKPTASYLIKLGLIRKTDEGDKYAFTGKGLEYTEVEILGKTNYFNALDEEYFNIFEDISISDRERIILMTMVAMRAFSEKAAIDLKEAAGVQDHWWEVMLIINDMLIKHEVIKVSNSLRAIEIKSGIEHPASHIIRHSDRLPRATKGLFGKTGNNAYYLSIAIGNKIYAEKLTDILELIFGENRDSLMLSEISSEMRSFCRIHGIDILNSLEENYFDANYDEYITEGFDLLRMKYLNQSYE